MLLEKLEQEKCEKEAQSNKTVRASAEDDEVNETERRLRTLSFPYFCNLKYVTKVDEYNENDTKQQVIHILDTIVN